jgi:hypothetical protein
MSKSQRHTVPLSKTRDLCCKTGAERQARELDAYWRAQGYPQVQHWIERVVFTAPYGNPKKLRNGESTHGIWAVRSNLVNGLPPKNGTLEG